MFFDRHRAFYIQCKRHFTFNVKTLFPYESFFPAIWDTICHYPLQYNPPTVNSATMIASISKLSSSLSCFFPYLTVVSLSQCHLLMVSYRWLALGLWAQAPPFHCVLDSIIYLPRGLKLDADANPPPLSGPGTCNLKFVKKKKN